MEAGPVRAVQRWKPQTNLLFDETQTLIPASKALDEEPFYRAFMIQLHACSVNYETRISQWRSWRNSFNTLDADLWYRDG